MTPQKAGKDRRQTVSPSESKQASRVFRMMDGAMSREDVNKMIDRAPMTRSMQSLKTVETLTPLKKSKIGITRKMLDSSKRFSVTNTSMRLAAQTKPKPEKLIIETQQSMKKIQVDYASISR